MTRKRDGVYVWVTWLSKLMAGDVQCQWSAWFRSHFANYIKAPSNFQLAPWTVEHNKCLDELCTEHREKSLAYFRESQNSFTDRRGKMIIGGKPDLVVLGKDDKYTVYDVKTGQPRASDVIQVMLYMAFLPYTPSGRYKGKNISGCVSYKENENTLIPAESLNDAFNKQITHFLDILDVNIPPPKTPSFIECQYCDITNLDCPDRIDVEQKNTESGDLPI